MWLLTLVGSKLLSLASTVLAVGTLAIGLIFYGRKTERANQKAKDLESYKDTRERIDEAHVNATVADSIKRLQDNDQLR